MTTVGLAALLYGEWKGSPGLRAAAKPFASLGFIVAAIGFGALESHYGNIVLVGLILGAIGDVCLLGQAKQYFIAGLVSFLLGHVAYVVAFSSLPISVPPALMAAVIAAMCVVAVGAGAAGAPWMIPVGAVMFTASDIAVVRDRFVAPGFVNRLWGLPLYYAAQLIIAWSIMAVNG
ncbi:MAG: lysoplasmalogenase [Deltaproteobacteria bacterium]|nr:lysoplasmalogenase [Deltaproteobacteria bacterium]